MVDSVRLADLFCIIKWRGAVSVEKYIDNQEQEGLQCCLKRCSDKASRLVAKNHCLKAHIDIPRSTTSVTMFIEAVEK